MDMKLKGIGGHDPLQVEVKVRPQSESASLATGEPAKDTVDLQSARPAVELPYTFPKRGSESQESANKELPDPSPAVELQYTLPTPLSMRLEPKDDKASGSHVVDVAA